MGTLLPPDDRLPAVLAGDQLTSAVRAARAVAGRLAAEPGTHTLRTTLGPWAQGVMLSVRTPQGRRRCAHLIARPVQPIVVPAPSILVCDHCYEAGRHGEGPASECPGCHTPVTSAGPHLRPVVTQESLFVLAGRLCARCVLRENER